jgi:hypothetical protein
MSYDDDLANNCRRKVKSLYEDGDKNVAIQKIKMPCLNVVINKSNPGINGYAYSMARYR